MIDMRKIHVLGIDFTDYTLREGMKKVDEYLRDGKVSSIGYITTKGLMEANDTPAMKEWMESLDLAIPADADILRAAGVESMGRIREVEENLFIKEFLKKAAKGRRSIFLLAETREQMGSLSKTLLGYQEHLKIVGTYAMEELQADEDYVVNEINIAAPEILISQLPSPRRETFYENNKMKLNTEVWLMLKAGMIIGDQHKNLMYRFYDNIIKKMFRHRVMHFEKETDE